MYRSSKSSDRLEIAARFNAQSEYILNKRSVRISLQDFGPTTSLGDICNTLAMVLGQHNPPIYLERILMAENQISEIPAEFWQLCSTLLRTLDLHANQLSELPPILAQKCLNLEMLDVSGNRIVEISDQTLAPLKRLKLLLLKDNKITHLPLILGEMISLETLGVAGNPLVFPPAEIVNSASSGINELKAFLVSSSAGNYEAKGGSGTSLETQIPGISRQPHPSTPGLARTRSLSDTRSRSLKALRRMGLIINSNKLTPDKQGLSALGDAYTPSKPARKLLLPSREKSDIGAFISDAREHPFGPELAAMASNYAASSSNTPSSNPVEAQTGTGTGAGSGSGAGTLSVSVSPPKSVPLISVKESGSSPEETAEVDPKPAAYFRRLSILQEKPLDEVPKLEEEPEFLKQPAAAQGSKAEISPLKTQPPKRKVSNAYQQTHTSSSSSSSATQLQLQLQLNHHVSRSGVVHEKSVVVKVSRKILFSFSELHLSIKRFVGFCGDKKLSSKIVRLIHSSKEHIDDLVEAMEAVEDGEENQGFVMGSLHACISSFKTILTAISENFGSLVAKIDACFIRMVLLTLFGSLNELQNAHKLLTQSSNPVRAPSSLSRNPSALSSSSADLKAKYVQSSQVVFEDISLETPLISSATEAVATVEEIDERLYQTITLATDNAQVVFSELTKTISKSAIATASTKTAQPFSPAVTAKFKELTHVCMTSMEITKRLLGKLAGIRQNQDSASRRSFWDDINLFLKAVIQTFSAVKDIMRDAPIFNEVRGSMANLTKTTKELTIILEASSYKSISDSVESPPNNNMWHMSNGPPTAPAGNGLQQPPIVAPIPAVRTPLVATVGTTAAQALLAQQDNQYGNGGHKHALPPFNLPPLVASDTLNSGLHTAPVQSMEQYYAKNVNPFDRL